MPTEPTPPTQSQLREAGVLLQHLLDFLNRAGLYEDRSLELVIKDLDHSENLQPEEKTFLLAARNFLTKELNRRSEVLPPF